MVTLLLLPIVAGATALALANAQRLAPWFLAVGALLLGGLWLLGRLRIPWPDLGFWTLFVLNPYLLVTFSFVLVIAGGIGTAVRIARRFTRS
jgi:hypothetical protein